MTAQNIKTKHAFTTRIGGASRGIYSSLNLGQNLSDEHAHVKDNYALVCSALGIKEEYIVCSKQIHGAIVRVVTREDRGRLYECSEPEADALITRDSGVALVVFVSDCVPILLHDPVRRVIGAVHAGWRGTAADITGVAVQRMSDEFGCLPADIRAAIGPSISACCYETDRDVADAMQSRLSENADTVISMRGEKYMVDLKEANRLLLRKAGVCEITISDECTSCSSEKYWSHRRTNGRRGSQTAIIVASW